MLAMVLLLSSIGRLAEADGYKTGNALLAACTGADLPHCMGYLFGIADDMDRNPINGFRACIPRGVLGDQLRDVAVDFLRRHATIRHRQANGMVAEAYEDAFPCR